VVVLTGLLLACGGDGSSDEAEPRSIPVKMTDNAFSTSKVTAEAGETVVFEFANEGEFEHEAVIGDASVQDAHEAEMSKPGAGVTMPQPGAEATVHTHGSGSGGSTVTVAPGDSAILRYTFDQAGSVLVGCHIPGHYRDGMKFEVKVA
jgi:uncharacterized cupredoxin-like copper-binding protein